METTKRVISIYSEATPNPATMKFVLNKMLFARNHIDFQKKEDVDGCSPFADELFGFPFVKGVFISNNFVTVTKTAEADWNEIIPSLREFIRDYVSADKKVIHEEKIQVQETKREKLEGEQYSKEDEEIVNKIKEVLTQYVQPAVEMDGGSIVFRAYEDGVVKLGMQGSCSGCPSSTITLKAGIEGMMKRMIPEVTEVVADAM